MKSNARWCLVGGLRVGGGICGMRDVLYSGGNVGYGDGWGSELYACVGSGRLGSVP